MNTLMSSVKCAKFEMRLFSFVFIADKKAELECVVSCFCVVEAVF